jgi:hypothetical protein
MAGPTMQLGRQMPEDGHGSPACQGLDLAGCLVASPGCTYLWPIMRAAMLDENQISVRWSLITSGSPPLPARYCNDSPPIQINPAERYCHCRMFVLDPGRRSRSLLPLSSHCCSSFHGPVITNPIERMHRRTTHAVTCRPLEQAAPCMTDLHAGAHTYRLQYMHQPGRHTPLSNRVPTAVTHRRQSWGPGSRAQPCGR